MSHAPHRPAAHRLASGVADPAAGRRVMLADTAEIVHLGLLLATMSICGLMLPQDGYPEVVVAYGLALLAVLGWACLRQIVTLPAMVWSALVWYRLGTAVFVGFGTTVPYFVNERSRAYIDGVYNFTDREAMKFMAMAILSSIVVLSVARFFHVRVPPPSRCNRNLAADKMLTIAIAFLLLGGVARYGVLVPKFFGMSDAAIAGWLSSIAKTYAAGLFLLLLWTLKYRQALLFIPVILIIVDAMVGLLSWDKSELIFTLAFAYLAIIYSKFSMKRAAFGLLAVIGIIYLSQPLVHYGRSQIALGEPGSVSQRLAVTLNYLDSQEQAELSSASERSPLVRMSYVGPALFFMNRYDAGMPGDAHDTAFAALVPRILWPNKPIVGAAGAEAYFMVRGRTGTSLGITHFGEAYWSFGWLGAFIVFIPGGLILALMTVRSVQLVLDERWFQLPIVLLSVSIGYKVMGAWVPGMAGAFATFVVFSAIFTVIERFIFPPATRPRRPVTRTRPGNQARPI